MFLPINTDNGNIEHGAGAGGGILDGELLWNVQGSLVRKCIFLEVILSFGANHFQHIQGTNTVSPLI